VNEFACNVAVITGGRNGHWRGGTAGPPALDGMMRPEDVAEAVMFVLSRPRTHRILEVAFRAVTEESWG
jgi:hypothetical protein